MKESQKQDMEIIEIPSEYFKCAHHTTKYFSCLALPSTLSKQATELLKNMQKIFQRCKTMQ